MCWCHHLLFPSLKLELLDSLCYQGELDLHCLGLNNLIALVEV